MMLTEKQKELIEQLGVINDRKGMQPTASRISALLLVSDKTELTFEEIREALSLSKSTISTALNLFCDTNRLDFITKPGDRKRYYRLKLDRWREDLKKEIDTYFEMVSVLKLILETRPASTAQFNIHLAEIVDFIEYVHTELPKLYAKWDNK